MSGFVDRIEPHLMNQSKLLPSANILIAFRNTIRVSADILIASADTLIVVKKKKRKAENTWSHSLPKSYFLL